MPKPLPIKQETAVASTSKCSQSTTRPSSAKLHDCLIGGKALTLLVDRKSRINIMSLDQFKKLHAENFKFFTTDMVPATVEGFKFAGQCTSRIEINGRSMYINFSIREGSESHVIVSGKMSEQLGIVAENK